jgi:hypothetical protein
MDFEIYNGKSFQDLCKDIVVGRESRRDQIDILISELRPLIKNVNDAMVIVPLIKGYLDTSNVNDGNIVRLASIIQKLITSAQIINGESGDSGFGLTEEEKKSLLKEAEMILSDQNNITVKKSSKSDD